MLSNAYFLAKFRFDTAENEPAKNLQNFANFPNFADPPPTAGPQDVGSKWPGRGGCHGFLARTGRRRDRRVARLQRGGGDREPFSLLFRQFSAKFRQMLLVFGCIGTDFCKKICVSQHFSKSTGLSSCNF